MKTLSADAIRVLRQIHTRGLTVLWSFRVPHPKYDDGEAMDTHDWQVADRELWCTVEVEQYVETERYTLVEREVARYGGIAHERQIIYGDGRELTETLRVVGMATGLPDGTEISRRETVKRNGETIRYRQWQSDWIKREKIDADEWTEEFVGVCDRYLLTDAALALL